MQAWVIGVMGRYGALGLFFLILLENVCPPIPSEVILAFGGFMTLQSELSVAVAVCAATAGSVAGALVLYGIGRWLDTPRLEHLVRRYGRFVGLRMENVHKALGWYAAYEKRTVFFCRMLPIVRSLISIPAGMAHMRLGPFLLLTTAGSLLWNAVLVCAGRALGHAWSGISAYMDTYARLLWGAIALLIVYLVVRRRRKKRARRPVKRS